MKKIIILPLIFIIFVSLTACGKGQNNDAAQEIEPAIPDSTAVEAEENLISQMKTHIIEADIAVNSFILIKDGEVVEEIYFSLNADRPTQMFSCTKSVISALVGIAVSEGKIDSVDEKVVDLIDTQGIDLSDEQKYDITLRDLLTMSSGLETFASTEFLFDQDVIKNILEKPMTSKPGERFVYSNAGPHIISKIIEQATGMETSQYAQEKLFDPLGISNPVWWKDGDGLACGGAGPGTYAHAAGGFGDAFFKQWKAERKTDYSRRVDQ